MIWANKKEQRIKANPKARAKCRLCNNEVIAKCGEIKIWHWAHKAHYECDCFGEPETVWHIKWKEMFNKELQEVIIKNHRADIKNKQGLVIEFQNSSISQEQIITREEFYKKMVWILNGNTLAKNFGSIQYIKGENFLKYFDWKWFSGTWLVAKKPIYIDISSWDKDTLFKIKKLYPDGSGNGIRISKTTFIIEKGGKHGGSND